MDGHFSNYVVIARKHGEMWYVGCLTDENELTLTIPLDFLDPNKSYVANVYSDAPGSNRTGVGIERIYVDCKSVYEVKMAVSGGCALWIVPIVK